MARIQVVYPDEQEALVDTRVAALRRQSRSHFVACLIEDDLRTAGLIAADSPSPDAALLAQITTAMADPDLRRDIEGLLARARRSRRSTRQPAAA